jgi:hypothetical protein
MFESLRRTFSGDAAKRVDDLEDELRRLREGIEHRGAQLDQKRQARLAALFPGGPVEGFRAASPGGPARYPGLDPFNFEETEEQSLLVAVAQRVVDGFPGGESLLSQLDGTLRAFSEANHYRVEADGPYGELLAWRDETLAAWDLPDRVPLYISYGGGVHVVGFREPFVVLDRLALDPLPPAQRRFLLATCLGHVFFGNLRLFAFHRLMEVLDRMPSMASLIARGVGLIPVVGATISRGLELARTVNDQLIRKTNLVVGLRQHLLCDRLAILATGDVPAAEGYLVSAVLGDLGEGSPAVHARLVEQGRVVHERFEQGQVDLHMLSVVGPDSAFAAYRAYKLHRWREDPRAARIGLGLYVTRDRLAEFRRSHRLLEDEIRALEARLLELHERVAKVETELTALKAEQVPPETPPPG